MYYSKSFLFPQLDCAILTTTGKYLPIGTHGYTLNKVFMPREGVQEVSCLQVPQLDCLIPTATGKGLPIGTDGYTINAELMPCEGADTIPGEIFRRYQRFRFYRLLL